MGQSVDERFRDEHEFWERRFDDPADPGMAAALGAVDPGGTDGDRAARGRRPVGRRSASPAQAVGKRAGEPTDELAGEPLDTPIVEARRHASARTVDRPLLAEPEMAWRGALEWLRDRRGDPRLGVVALVVVAVLAGFVWYRIGLGGSDSAPPPTARASASSDQSASAATDARTGTETAGAPTAGSTRDDPDAVLVVHVAGAVARPGVVELPRTSRVIDALEAVGGATAEADVDRLNLAALLVDGSRVYVAKRGEADPGVLGAGAAGSGGGPSPGATSGPVNLNTATLDDLDTLPGIGPTYAQAIIAERTRRGGFRSVNELREVRGIGDKRFADLAPLVTV